MLFFISFWNKQFFLFSLRCPLTLIKSYNFYKMRYDSCKFELVWAITVGFLICRRIQPKHRQNKNLRKHPEIKVVDVIPFNITMFLNMKYLNNDVRLQIQLDVFYFWNCHGSCGDAATMLTGKKWYGTTRRGYKAKQLWKYFSKCLLWIWMYF